MALPVRDHRVEILAQGIVLQAVVRTVKRVSDLINETDEFLTLHDVLVRKYGDPEDAAEAHTGGLIDRSSIELMSEIVMQEGPTETTAVPGLHIPKVPYRVRLYTTNYEVDADFHVAREVDIDTSILMFKGRFIPLTRALIASTSQARPAERLQRGFLLVNRSQLNYFGPTAMAPPVEI